MYHSITIGGKNTWDDWRLVPASRPVFNPPAQKVKTLEIPGGDGVIDLSQSLTGYPVYQNRTGSIEFIVMNDFKPWHMAYSDIMDYLHGQKLRAVLEDDPEYFYEGRFTVNVWKSEKDWSRITIDYDVGPYKWSVLSSTDDWLWGPFNFQNGVIRPAVFKDIAVTTEVRAVKLAALLFGFCRALGNVYSGFDFLLNMNIPSVVYNMLPYIISLVVLAFTSKKSRAPKAEGIPYDKGSR